MGARAPGLWAEFLQVDTSGKELLVLRLQVIDFKIGKTRIVVSLRFRVHNIVKQN